MLTNVWKNLATLPQVARTQKALTLACVLTVWSGILSSPAANSQETVSRTSTVQILPPASTTNARILVMCQLSAGGTLNASFGTTFHFASVLVRPLATQHPSVCIWNATTTATAVLPTRVSITSASILALYRTSAVKEQTVLL